MSSNPWLNKNKPNTGIWATQDVRRLQANQQLNQETRQQSSNRPQQSNQQSNQAWNQSRSQQPDQETRQQSSNRPQQSSQQSNQAWNQQSNQAWNESRPQKSNQETRQQSSNRPQQSSQQSNQAWNQSRPQQSEQAWNQSRSQQSNQKPNLAWNHQSDQAWNQSRPQSEQNTRSEQQSNQMKNIVKSKKSSCNIKSLNKKLLMKVFSYLPTEDLSSLNCVSNRMRNAVQSLVGELQVLFEFEDDVPFMDDSGRIEFRPVTLRYTPPDEFFYEYTPFPLIKKLYLCFDNDDQQILNLTKLRQLRYLKIRGANIQLSCNRLPSVTQVDIDDPNCCQKQVFRNIKNFHLEADIENLSTIHNSSEFVTGEFIFTKSLDILLAKSYLEQVSFTVYVHNMDLLNFEKIVDSLGTFLKSYQEEINVGHVNLVIWHSNYNESENDRRWPKVWEHLRYDLENDYSFFTIEIKKL